jgi:LAO/AO transport system kinase
VSARKVKPETLLAADRLALARAITLVESTRAADRLEAEALLTAILPFAGRAIRIGISGAPGVGKSTFIEAFGGHLTGTGRKVAVLAVDPSSRRSGGSILGDKTRMERLSRDPNAFIRPSPAGTTLGGVARRTHEAMLLVEAAGFDVVIVETVGVGQSETAVADMVDVFLLLIGPGAGDELQGIKRGVMELADLVVVTKGDGDLLAAAHRAASDYRAAVHLMRPKFPGLAATVQVVSALAGAGVAETWEAITRFHGELEVGGYLQRLRDDQARRWFWTEVEAVLADAIANDPAAAALASQIEADVVAGRALPHSAARGLVASILGSLDGCGIAP